MRGRLKLPLKLPVKRSCPNAAFAMREPGPGYTYSIVSLAAVISVVTQRSVLLAPLRCYEEDYTVLVLSTNDWLTESCSLRIQPSLMSLAARSQDRRLYSQAMSDGNLQ